MIKKQLTTTKTDSPCANTKKLVRKIRKQDEKVKRNQLNKTMWSKKPYEYSKCQLISHNTQDNPRTATVKQGKTVISLQ